MDNFCDKCRPDKQCSTCTLDDLTLQLENATIFADKYPNDKRIRDFKAEIEQKFNTFNTNYRNHQEVTTFARALFEEEHDRIQFKEEQDRIPTFTKLVQTKELSCLMHAPTQVGKTKASKDFIQVCVDKGINVIMSCDNKTDQRDQLASRLGLEFAHQDDVEIIMADSTSLCDQVKDGVKKSKKLVVLCLDNEKQINKTQNAFVMAFGYKRFDSLMIIHDEGDMTVKNDDVMVEQPDSAKSHNKWIEFVNCLSEKGVELKRVFVTATPEAILIKYPIKHVVNLHVPNNYTGYSDIEAFSICDNEYDVKLKTEQDKIYASGESGVILYCTDRKIGDGQDLIFVASCEKLRCTVSTYNGTGITVRPENFKAFKEKLDRFKFGDRNTKRKKKLEYQDKSTNDTKGVLLIKNLKINDFYKICLDSGNKVVVTIGMDLMARGISFVSSKPTSDEERSGGIIPGPLCAITMIYKPGETQTAVNINQIIGRLTGTVRPDLQRTLFSPKSVIDTYKKYNENQKQILKEIRENSGIITSKIMEDLYTLHKLEHRLTKPKLNCNLKYKQLKVDVHDLTDEEKEKVYEMIDVWNNDMTTIIGKIFRYIKEKKKVSKDELYIFLKGIGASDTWYSDISDTQKRKNYHLTFIRKQDGSTTLRQEVFDFFDNSEKQGR